MRKNKKFSTCTRVKCEHCDEHIISPMEKIPEKCPYCKESSNYTIVSLSFKDREMFIDYIKQEG